METTPTDHMIMIDTHRTIYHSGRKRSSDPFQSEKPRSGVVIPAEFPPRGSSGYWAMMTYEKSEWNIFHFPEANPVYHLNARVDSLSFGIYDFKESTWNPRSLL